MLRKIQSTLSFSVFILLFTLFIPQQSEAQSVSVGAGSYSTTLPPGGVAPDASPKISSSVTQPIRTNTFWSSLIFPFRGNPHSNNIFAHPLSFKATNAGLEMGYTPDYYVSDREYVFPYSSQLTVGVSGLNASQTLTDDYGEWTVTALWDDGSQSMKATFGHGLPYAFFTVSGGNAMITTSSTPNIWRNDGEVLGIEVDGRFYGLFAPTGSTWTGNDVIESSLNGQDFFSVALLPDSTLQTLELFRKHAYAFVIDSKVEWVYDEDNAELISTYSYETVLKDNQPSNLNETMTALYRHQWMHTTSTLTNHTYNSPRGIMKLREGNEFVTSMRFSGILPALPDVGKYDRAQLLSYVQEVATETLPVGPTYENGKAMARFAQLIHIADQIGAITERDHFLAELKNRLEDWFTVGGPQEYSYNSTWYTLTGYPSGFGADRELNDHHFHASYAIQSAATIAQFDSAWASQENWGGMVNLLIKDSNNWDEADTRFPTLRNHDSYAGHSWAAGHADFESGNNQESSSESMNFSTGVILWGEVTNQPEVRDLGIFLYTSENEAIDQYWFDVDDEVFPPEYAYTAVGMVWGNKGLHDTWFGNAPEFIHGINFLPMTSGSFYFGRNPEHIIENYNAIVGALGGQPTVWKDVIWQYLSLSDPEKALSLYHADPNYVPFDGESRAHTLHWLYNMKAMGQYNTDVTADIPTYTVFVSEYNDTTYTAFNAGHTERLVTFSDGYSILVPANTMISESTAITENSIPESPSSSYDPNAVFSVFSDQFANRVSANFDIVQGQTTVPSIVEINRNNTLKFATLDQQTTSLSSSIDVTSKGDFHLDYYTMDATELSVYLIGDDQVEEKYDLTVTTNAWQSVDIPLSNFSIVDLRNVSKIKIVGNGTVYFDNIFFSGDPITQDSNGPSTNAPTPFHPSEDVISIFSDSYTNPVGVNYFPFWFQETEASFVEVGQNNILKYANLNYQGIDIGASINVSEMDYVHFDYWTSDATSLQLSLITPGPSETPVDLTVVQNSWQSIDIALSEYESVVNLSDIFQLKFDGNGTVFVDNIYFFKTPNVTAAPSPTRDSESVISLFSNAYDDVNVDTWSTDWDQATAQDVSIFGNNAIRYTNLTVAAIEMTSEPVDITNMTNFHFDMWTADPTNAPAELKVKLVDFGANGTYDQSGDDVESELTFTASTTPALSSNQWVHFDLPLSDFTGLTTKEHLAQIILSASNEINTVFLDNVYFYTTNLTSNEDELEIPNEVKLFQNYPNPFNPSTNIEFNIPEATQVSLTIFNSIGQQVATLVDSQLSPGNYSLLWDASNASSGVYYYQLKAGNITTTKQMLLIK